MSGLKHTMAAIPGGNTRRTYGTAHWDGSHWFARIGDSLLEARWLDPIQPLQGGKIIIDITNDGMGQSTALVIGGYTDQPRPSTGAILAVGVTDIIFTGEEGGAYSTDRFINPYVDGAPPRLVYAPGDQVYLTWDAAAPTILGIIPAVATVYVAPPPGPTGTTSGETALIATATDTYGVGGWGRWATSTRGGEDVYTGTQGGYTVTGAWFYGAAKPELAGKTITRIRFKVPARLNVGSYNAAVNINIYAHNSGSRPGGDVSRVAGPAVVGIGAGSGGGYIDLDVATFGPHLAAGGGISIAGGSYAGFNSRLDDPESGKILMNWSS
jgi:hypothetical protein